MWTKSLGSVPITWKNNEDAGVRVESCKTFHMVVHRGLVSQKMHIFEVRGSTQNVD